MDLRSRGWDRPGPDREAHSCTGRRRRGRGGRSRGRSAGAARPRAYGYPRAPRVCLAWPGARRTVRTGSARPPPAEGPVRACGVGGLGRRGSWAGGSGRGHRLRGLDVGQKGRPDSSVPRLPSLGVGHRTGP